MPVATAVLQQLAAAVDEEARALGSSTTVTVVTCSARASEGSRSWRIFTLARTGVEQFWLHDLRHTAAYRGIVGRVG